MKNSIESFENFANNETPEKNNPVIEELKIEREKTELENSAIDVLAMLKKHGHEGYFTGGYARDLALSKITGRNILPHDIDIATSAKTEEIKNIFSKTVVTGESFGVARVVLDNGIEIEVATFRSEKGTTDGRHPEKVSFLDDAAEDAKRRDFTINGMFYDPFEEKIIDYVGGLDDLENGRLKFIGDPHERIKEDNLRLLRAIRFKNRMGFKMPEDHRQAVEDNMKLIYNVSGERIHEELNKILMHPSRAKAMEDLYESGFFKRIIPEMWHLKGAKQPKEFHEEGDVWNHTLKCLENAEPDAPKEVVWAIMVHDIGKPIVVKTPERHGTDRIRFDAHEKESALVAEMRFRELKFSNEEVDKIKWLAANHMIYQSFPQMGLAKKRRLMQHPYFPDLLKVMKADVYGSEPLDIKAYDYIIEEWEEEQSRVKEEKKEPLLKGNDVMELLGLNPAKNKSDGKKVGEVLEKVKDAQLEGLIKTKEEALEFIRNNFAG